MWWFQWVVNTNECDRGASGGLSGKLVVFDNFEILAQNETIFTIKSMPTGWVSNFDHSFRRITNWFDSKCKEWCSRMWNLCSKSCIFTWIIFQVTTLEDRIEFLWYQYVSRLLKQVFVYHQLLSFEFHIFYLRFSHLFHSTWNHLRPIQILQLDNKLLIHFQYISMELFSCIRFEGALIILWLPQNFYTSFSVVHWSVVM